MLVTRTVHYFAAQGRVIDLAGFNITRTALLAIVYVPLFVGFYALLITLGQASL